MKSSLIRYDDLTNSHGLVTSILGLQVVLDGSHFRNGSMRVKCITSVSPLLWLNANGKYPQKRPPLVDNREAMLLGKFALSHIHTAVPSRTASVFSCICRYNSNAMRKTNINRNHAPNTKYILIHSHKHTHTHIHTHTMWLYACNANFSNSNMFYFHNFPLRIMFCSFFPYQPSSVLIKYDEWNLF